MEVGSEIWSEEVVPMMFWYGGHWPFWEVGLMWIGMLAFWVLIVLAIYAFVKSVSSSESARRMVKNASETLDKRLALREFDAKECGRAGSAGSRGSDVPGRKCAPDMTTIPADRVATL